MAKTLIAYYSQTGNTKRLVDQIAAKKSVDQFEITVPTGTFPNDMFKTGEVADQQKKSGQLPQLATQVPDLNGYDQLVVAGPNWSAGVATPVVTFLQSIQDFGGEVISVDTSVGQNDDQYNDDFKQQAGKLNVVATINRDAQAVVDHLH